MNSYTNHGIRLAALLTSTLAFGGLFVAAPAFAAYGPLNGIGDTPNTSSYTSRFNPNAIVEQWNYINTQSVQPVSYPYTNTYQTGYQAYVSPSQTSRFVPINYPTYYAPSYNYSNSSDYYNSSYNYSTGAYQYSYQYVEPASSYSYNYQEPQYSNSYDYSNESSNCDYSYGDCYNYSY